ncbi:hypothetical protein CLV59_109129 [Chitinophaga dinghuensis]|uniref:Uncharacterized protein n=2 Tax=Chitinophaga dinghuensis TaxID=1539050 RepID=A0A327VNX7_9BACT|nr:hypothetical protein CLV59_109129 [Chitinophaga dinghuensis]
MTDHEHLKTLTDIRKMMERSSRFISLSGLSGISAGISALIGAFIANKWFTEYYQRWEMRQGGALTDYGDVGTRNYGYSTLEYIDLRNNLILLGLGVMAAALFFGFLFTWRKAKRDNIPVWDRSARRLAMNAFIPLATGGIFILGLMYNHAEKLTAASCLIFYGLALINASKYTVSDVRYLGFTETALGLLNLFFLNKGLYFWAIGFGFCHILYGSLMWWKYERKASLQT